LLQRRDRTEIMRTLIKLVNAGIGVTVTVDHSNGLYRCLSKTDAYVCGRCCCMKFEKFGDAFSAAPGESACLVATFQTPVHVDALRKSVANEWRGRQQN
jgi:hypothetical protein